MYICIYVEWTLHNPTLCGQQHCVRLRKLSDQQGILSVVYCGDYISLLVGLERMLDYRGSTVCIYIYIYIYICVCVCVCVCVYMVCVYLCTYMYVLVCVHSYVCMYVCVYSTD